LSSFSASPSQKELDILNDIQALKASLKEISMMDNFAKFARTERQIAKLSQERQKLRMY